MAAAAADGPWDPFGFLARWFSEAWLHLLIQASAVSACAGVLYLQIQVYPSYGSKTQWWAETALFASFLAAFLVRSKPTRRSRGAREILLPLIASALPMAMVHWPTSKMLFALVPLRPAFPAVPYFLRLYPALIVGGDALACLGILSLRRSFSITPEARGLESGGLYRWMRHPIYAGELIAAFGIVLLRFHPRNCVLYLIFAALQTWRASREEEILTAVYPLYLR